MTYNILQPKLKFLDFSDDIGRPILKNNPLRRVQQRVVKLRGAFNGRF